MRAALIWGGLAALLALPLVLAATSPLLQWRDPIYIAAGFAGIIGLAMMVVQPLLARRALPGLRPRAARRLHAMVGATLVAAVITHVAGLWITSPPDVVDVLLFRSPTPFGIWGALAMWAVFAAATLALFRRRLIAHIWRRWHLAFTGFAVIATGLHAVLIEGTMEPVSKALLCLCAALGLFWAASKK